MIPHAYDYIDLINGHRGCKILDYATLSMVNIFLIFYSLSSCFSFLLVTLSLSVKCK